jgi:diguanylate cyclase (GGDEF)-like protein
MGVAGFFCRDEREREWLRELQGRLWASNRWFGLSFGIPLLVCFIWINPISAIPFALGAGTFRLAERVMTRTGRREFLGVAAFPVMAFYAAFAGTTGYIAYGALVIVVMPLAALAGCVPARVAVVLTIWTAFLMTLVAFIAAPDAILSRPPTLILPLGVMMSTAVACAAPRGSSAEHREASIVDPLTSMLNRKALTHRCAELTHQSTVTGESVGLIVCDLDHFKSVNDELGHATGDAVLVDLAYRLRKHLRTFDSAFRLGGEEFAVLVAGMDLEQSAALAERLAEAVRSEPLAGVPATASFGVAATKPGTVFDFEALFAQADAALYDAKGTGRDRVCLAGAAAAVPIAA